MVKAIRDEGQGVLSELGSMGVNSGPKVTQDTSTYIGVLQQFRKVFEWPNKLPPPRAQDHSIVMKPNSAPVNVHPYRYPYDQKNEIERLVREMLAARIIHQVSALFQALCY